MSRFAPFHEFVSRFPAKWPATSRRSRPRDITQNIALNGRALRQVAPSKDPMGVAQISDVIEFGSFHCPSRQAEMHVMV